MEKIGFVVDLGPILAPILALFWDKNGGTNEVEKEVDKKRANMKKGAVQRVGQGWVDGRGVGPKAEL